MPILDITLERINELLGKKLSLDELNEIVFQYGMEIESHEVIEGYNHLKIEITPDRPDMLSSYGFVRAIRKYLGLSKGLDRIEIRDSDYKIFVNKNVANIRPYIGAAVIKNVNLSEDDLLDLIYAQEKLHDTFCRSRVKASIGLYPYDKIKWPLRYLVKDPNEIVFRPLETDVKMNGLEILEKHPTGIKYAFILKDKKQFPVFEDADGNVLSMPPIINSEDHGKITTADKNILIEVTGIHRPTMEYVLNMMVYSILEIGGELYKVSVIYEGGETIDYPRIKPSERIIERKYVERILGIRMPLNEIEDLLMKMGYGVEKIDEEKIKVLIPQYRADVLHEIDIVDDIGRAYTYDKFEPELTPVFTIGSYLEKKYIIDCMREILIGMGYLEAYTFALTSTEDQFDKMNIEHSNYVRVGGAKERKLNMVRVWLLPELLKTLAYNKDKRKPIQLFELAPIVLLDKNFEAGAKNVYHLAALSAHSDASFTEIRRVLEYLLLSLNFENYKFIRAKHASFIEGRVAEVIVEDKSIGYVGELHPEVILNWGLDFPIAAFEININKLFNWQESELDVSE